MSVFKMGNSVYYKIRRKGRIHYLLGSLYEFICFVDLLYHTEGNISRKGQYSFRHDGECRAYVNYYSIK